MASTASRPQVGIERLPSTIRRNPGPEQRESMNCKSCRKRKIKCNRLRPTCEACKIFQCPCLYDAVPKKRGPKTDVLEALVKRIDGLEKRLAEEKRSSANASALPAVTSPVRTSSQTSSSPRRESTVGPGQHSPQDAMAMEQAAHSQVMFSPIDPSPTFPEENDLMIDAYFMKVQDKPFHVLDEATIRQQVQSGQLPQALRLAIYAVGSRFTNNNGDYATGVRISEGYAQQARSMVDVDEPSIEGLQTLLLIHRAFFAAGKGRKSYMILSMAVGMAIAMDLHREVPAKNKLTSGERELRRALFWTCYLMDRFTSCGSKRPSLISDNSMMLRLPSWIPYPGAMPTEGEYFSIQTNLQYATGSGQFTQASSVVLIDIARILGETNRYLANGGVKGDSHFPWHQLSNLSKIRNALDMWASGNQDLFTDVDSLFAHPDCVVFVLAKMIYHCIHCLIYRPFLPIDLAELRGTGQHQSWQIEATNLCFLHANAIADIARVARQSASMEWPAFAAYCIGTAGTVHVHGAHYQGQEGEVFTPSADYLAQQMQILSDLRYQWACTQFQRDMLSRVYVAHSDLVRSLGSNPLRFSPVFHLEDFFDRYPGHYFDGAHVSFVDVQYEATTPPSQNQSLESNSALQSNNTNNNNTSSTSLHPLTHHPPLTPSISQASHPARRYTDSAISMATSAASCDAHVAGTDFAYKGAFSPAYTFDPATPAQQTQQHSRFDPTLFSTPTPGPGDSAAGAGAGGAGAGGAGGGGGFGFGTPRAGFAGLGGKGAGGVGGAPGAGAAGVGNGGGVGVGGVGSTVDQPQGSQSATTPGAISASGSAGDDHDPFLKLLEQIAENEGRGGANDLDFFLGEAGEV